MVKTRLLALCLLIGLALGHGAAQAARSFSYVQSPAAASALYPMGSIQSLSYQVSNTNTGTNTGERIYQVRFRLNNGSLFSSTTAAPAGWTRSAFTTTSVTFQATSWANALAVLGGSATFTLVLAMASATANASQSLRDMRASYTTTTTGPPFSRAGRTTTNTPGSWTLKSLTITSFQITDTLGNAITSLASGGSFRLVMTVRNNSTVAQNGIVSNPNPITSGAVKTGTVTQVLTGTAGSPLNLASLASGTITYTFSTAASDLGTIYFMASAQRIASVTSNIATSTTLTVLGCALSAFTLPASASCLYVGSSNPLRMSITNNCVVPLATVTATLAAPPASEVTLLSGPVPATILSIAVGATATVDWTYQIKTTSPFTPFAFSATVASVSPLQTTPAITSFTITPAGFPITPNPSVTDASSTNFELTWSVTNSGCAAAKSVAVTFPAGWVWASDVYSLVNLSAMNPVETWTSSGANPVTFASPDIPNQLPQTFSGDFSLVFSATPASAGTSTFTVNVTDANGVTVPVSVPVTVNPFDPTGSNSVTNGIRIWREQFP